MDSVLAELAGGDRRTLGKSKAVAEYVLRHPERVEELLEGVLGDDAVVRARAIDSLEVVSARRPDLIQPHKRLLLTHVAALPFWEVREHICLMLPRLKLTAMERRRAFEIVRGYLGDKASIVRTFAMQAMVDLSEGVPEMRDEACQVVESALSEGTPAMRARARNLVKRIRRA